MLLTLKYKYNLFNQKEFMNWNDNNSGPWGSGGGNNPWGSGPSNRDFENTIKKSKR